MKLKFLLITIAIGITSGISAEDSHGNWSNEKVAPVYSYIYEIKEEKQDARSQTRAPESYEKSDTDSRPAVTTVEYLNNDDDNDDDDRSDSGASSEISGEEEAVTIEIIDSTDPANSEEKDQTETRRRSSIRIIQPYIVNLESQKTSGESGENQSFEDTSGELQRTVRTSQNSGKSSSENVTEESRYSVVDNLADLGSFGNFGAKVRSVLLQRENYVKNSERNKTRVTEDGISGDNTLDLKKKKTGGSSVSSSGGSSKFHGLEDVYRGSHTVRKNNESLKSRNEENESEVFVKNNENSNNIKNIKNIHSDEENIFPEFHSSEKIPEYGTSSTTVLPVSAISLKFSKPIVVPDLPRQKKYSYQSTTEYLENNIASSTEKNSFTPRFTETKTKNRGSEFNYLSPLQAGLTLLNAGDILDNADNTENANEERDIKSDGVEPEIESEIIKDDSSQTDQILEQQEISDAVTQKLPVNPVEIQKSVEIYHTAPIQEIHYPVEFVPNIPKASNRRPLQSNFNIYKSNEIVDEKIQSSNLRTNPETYRYENNVETESKKIPNQDQYNESYEQYNPQIRIKLVSHPVDIEEGSKQVGEYNFEFQRINPPGILNQEQIQSTKLTPLVEVPIKSESIENLEIRKVPQFLLPIGQTYPVEKIVEKTVHIPHPISIEKLVEKKVPYPIEKVIEKQVMIPHPYPIHIQVPVDRVVEKQIRIPHIYPIHIEKVIEKKIPYTLQRLIVQPYPVHINVPQGIPLEKSVHIPRSYFIELEKQQERIRPYQIEIPKYIKPSGHYNNVPSHYNSEKSYPGVRTSEKNSLYRTVPEGNQANSSQYSDQGYNTGYNPVHQVIRQPGMSNQLSSRKYSSYGTYYSPNYATMSVAPQAYRRRAVYAVNDKEKSEYVNSVIHQGSFGILPKNLQYSPKEIQSISGSQVSSVSSRRARQEGGTSVNTGAFRQSKMEYGFKPPMVPSVQYDENTASKVEQ